MCEIMLQDKQDYIKMIKFLIFSEKIFSASIKNINSKECFIIIVDPEITLTIENTIHLEGFENDLIEKDDIVYTDSGSYFHFMRVFAVEGDTFIVKRSNGSGKEWFESKPISEVKRASKALLKELGVNI